MSFRFAIAGVVHETNTYCKGTTGQGEFIAVRGERVFRLDGTRTDVGGMLHAAKALGATPVPILWATAHPSGMIDAETYADFKAEILAGLDADLDAVALSMHGAGVVDGIDDLEGDLAAAVRERVGASVPIVATFDLHGNITQAMADAIDMPLVCHHYPHEDLFERGDEAVGWIPRLLAREVAPVSVVESVPMLLPTTTTFLGAGQDQLDFVLELERTPGVMDISFFHGFPYTDVPQVGCHFIVTTDGDRALAERTARVAAERLWQHRESFRARSLSAKDAVAEALALGPGEGPIVINETSDNPGGGAPGDGTHLLRALVEAKAPDTCFGFIVDPITAAAAVDAGEGAEIDVALGGRYDELHGTPLVARALVESTSDGRFVYRVPMLAGVRARLGASARLRIGGIEVLVVSERNQTFGPEVFEANGIDVMGRRIVALKSSNHFRSGFQSIARAIVTADPPGLTTHHIEVFPRSKNAVPVWPIHPDAAYG